MKIILITSLILSLVAIVLAIIAYFKNNKDHFTHDIPFFVISDKVQFIKSKKRLNEMGFFNIKRIAPVYLSKSLCPPGSKRLDGIKIKIEEEGCSAAHKNAMKEIKKINKASIILEQDWITTLDNDFLFKKINEYYNLHKKNKRSLTFLGSCGHDYGCTHAYIASPSAANIIINTNSCKNPIDYTYIKLCKNNFNCTKVKNFNKNKKYFGTGLIWQDRVNINGFHKADHSLDKNYLKNKIKKFGSTE